MTRPGDPAFPSFERVDVYRDETYRTEVLPVGGMTLRDYFAAQALAGVYASGSHRDVAAEIYREQRVNEMNLSPTQIGRLSEERIAAMVYALADAMLAAREGK